MLRALRETKEYKTAYKRLSRVSEYESLNWAEQTLNSLHQNLDLLRRSPSSEALAESRKALSALSAVLDVVEQKRDL